MHSHSHDHGHQHFHTQQRLELAFWLNLIFAFVEFFGGLWIGSFAVTSNAIHDLGDSSALAISMLLEKKSHKKSDMIFSYGYRRLSIASAFLTSIFLVSGSCLVIFFGIKQLFETNLPKADGMMLFAILGIAINVFSLWTLKKGQSVNERVLSWHFVEDTMSWVLVLATSFLIRWSGWGSMDVVLGLILSAWILWNVQKNIREVLGIFLQATPKNISLESIEKSLASLAQVQSVHHLHLWTMDGQEHILTAHIVLKKGLGMSSTTELKLLIKKLLKAEFKISEATLEFEIENESCQDPEHT